MFGQLFQPMHLLLVVVIEMCIRDSYPPTLVKKTLVGAGRAEKEQVAFMVAQILGLRKPDWALDASDALAVAICHLNQRRMRKLAGGA